MGVLRWGGHSEAGPVRSLNEDRWRASPFPDGGGLFAVADGMGSMVEACSQGDMAIEEIAHHYRSLAPEDRLSEAAAVEAYRRASQALEARERQITWELGGCTLATVMVQGDQARVAWLGDSRVLRVRGDELLQLSTDHTLARAMVDAGKLTEAEAQAHAYQDIVTRSMRGEFEAPETVLVSLEPQDRLVLMTDGCWKPLSEAALAQGLEEYIPQRAAEALVRSAHTADGRDNGAAVVLWWGEAHRAGMR